MAIKSLRKPAIKSARLFAADWKMHIQACREQAMTSEDYCRINKLSQSRFEFWIRQLQKSGINDFVPAIIQNQPSVFATPCNIIANQPERHCTFEFGNGKRLFIESTEALAQITQLLKEVL